jgi:catechol 2,3-dioxygenase-like lactoylglutathione lyase family enzyme
MCFYFSMPESRHDIIVLVVASSTKFFVLEYSAGLTTLATQNFDGLVEFYTRLFDREPNPYREGIYAGWQIPGLELGIFQPAPANQAEFAATGGSFSLCLEVVDLDRALTFVEQLGRVTPVSIASHGRECYLYDPDGNRIILHQGSDPRPPKNL